MQKPPCRYSTWGLPGFSPRQREPGHLALPSLVDSQNLYPQPAYYQYIWKLIVSWEYKWGMQCSFFVPTDLWVEKTQGGWKTPLLLNENCSAGGFEHLCAWTWRWDMWWISLEKVEMKENHPYNAPWRLPVTLGPAFTIGGFKICSLFCLYSHFGHACPRKTCFLRIVAWPCFPSISVWPFRWSPINSPLFSFLYHVTNSLAYCEKSPKPGHILKHSLQEDPTLPRRNCFLASFSFLSQRDGKAAPSSLTWSSSQRKHPVLTMFKSPQNGALRGTSVFHWALLSPLLCIIFPLKIIHGYYRKFRLL